MEIRKTTAFILKSIDWSESSKILTCFTHDFGKISLLVRGAKRSKSKFSGLCEPLHEIDLIYDYKPSRELDIVREIDLKRNHSDKLSSSYENFYYGLSIVELVDKITEYEDENSDIYEMLAEYILHISSNKHPESYFFKFCLGLVNVLGYHLSFDTCGSCGNILIKKYQYRVEYGVVCENCVNDHISNMMSIQMFSCFRAISKFDLYELSKVSINKELQKDMLYVLYAFIEHHFQMKLRLKSLSFVINT